MSQGEARQLRDWLVLALALAISAAWGSMAPAPAEATHGSPSDCPSGAVCLYRHTGFHDPRGSGWVFYGTNSSLHSWAIADNDRSVANLGTTGRAARVFRLTSHRIAHYCLHNGFVVSNLGSWSGYASSNDWPWPSTCGVSPQSPLPLYPLGTQT